LEYLPAYFVLPHPSPRNNIWMVKNKWFENEVLPESDAIVSKIIKKASIMMLNCNSYYLI